VLAADPELELGPLAPAARDRDPDQLADAQLVDLRERRPVDDSLLDVGGDDASSTSSREPPIPAWVRPLVPNEKKSA
jgi:hypothetical protein